MFEQVLLLIYYLVLFIFGVVTSFAFCNVNIFEEHQRKEPCIWVCLLSVVAQLVSWLVFGDTFTWKLYPLLAHVPIVFVLCKFYQQQLISSVTAVACAYFLCQPAKWVGLFFYTILHSTSLEIITRILMLILVAWTFIRYVLKLHYPILGYNKKRNIIFCVVPIVYYCYDYYTGVYGYRFETALMIEFLPLVLCISYFNFLMSYYYEYEQKMYEKHNAEFNGLILSQQRKEIESIKKSNEDIRLLRHDMRHLIDNTVYLLSQNNTEAALKILSSFNQGIEATYVKHYCDNELLNYVISNFAQKCEKENIKFVTDIKIPIKLHVDETILISILSNSLENAINAQKELENNQKVIYFYLKSKDNKILLSIKNPFSQLPIFEEGLPITNQKGHGYGVRSIKYLTESLGGSCEFLVKDNLFTLRLVV